MEEVPAFHQYSHLMVKPGGPIYTRTAELATTSRRNMVASLVVEFQIIIIGVSNNY